MAKIGNLKKGRAVLRARRHKRIRKKVWGTAERPRFVVYRSLRNMEGQLVDDEQSQLPLTAPAGVDVRWLHRAGPSGSAHPGTLLVAAVEAMARPGHVASRSRLRDPRPCGAARPARVGGTRTSVGG